MGGGARSRRAAIEMYLVEAANRSFEPDELDVAEAIKVTQRGAKPQQQAPDPYDDPEYDYEREVADIRERLVQKLQALRRRDRPALLAQGWSYDEEYDREIPPGWVRAGD